jgi:hypothetical protein
MQRINVLQNIHPPIKWARDLFNFETEDKMPPDVLRDMNAIAKSQYNVAKMIEKNPDAAFIVENNNVMQYKDNADARAVQKEFPSGLPPLFEDLSFQQKRLLCLHLGSGYAVHNKVISYIHSDDLTFYLLEKHIMTGVETFSNKRGQIEQTREYLSLLNAQSIAKKTGKEVYLLFGSAHKIIDVAECFPKLKVEIKNYHVPYGNFDNDDFIARFHAIRPPVNCTALARGFQIAPSIASSEVAGSSSMAYGIGVGIVALGMGLYGLFACCKSQRRQSSPAALAQPTFQRKHR